MLMGHRQYCYVDGVIDCIIVIFMGALTALLLSLWEHLTALLQSLFIYRIVSRFIL